jgi:hypothetical protein
VENDEAAEVKGGAAAPPREAVKTAATEPSATKPPAAPSDSAQQAPPSEPGADIQAAAPLPAPTPARSESELAAAQLAALSGKRAVPAVDDALLATPPVPQPNPSVQAVKPIATAAPAPVSESGRAAAQLAALSGKPAASASAAPPAVASRAETASALATPALHPTAPPARTRCDEPLETARIEPGDRLAIHVDHVKEVSDTVEVGSDGRVHLPLVGTVPAAGRNQREFVADLTQRLTVYLQAPRVDVALERDCGR